MESLGSRSRSDCKDGGRIQVGKRDVMFLLAADPGACSCRKKLIADRDEQRMPKNLLRV